VRAVSAYERIYVLPHLVVIAERVTRASAQRLWRSSIPPHDDFVRSRVEDSPTKDKTPSVTQKEEGGQRAVVGSPVFRRKGLYEDGVSRREIDDLGIGEGRKGILAQKVEDEDEIEGQSQVVEVTHVWAFVENADDFLFRRNGERA
jgi:hypothetical protein